MCVGPFAPAKPPETPKIPTPVASTPPPPPAPVQTAPTPLPATPTPAPRGEDETKKKAKVTAKKVAKKVRARGTTQLQTKAPTTGLRGINTGQGVNTGTPTEPTPTRQY